MCITEYNEELHLKNVYEEGVEKGLEQGRAEGLQQGVQKGLQHEILSCVEDGIYNMEVGAKRAHMELKEFRKLYLDFGRRLPKN